MRLLIAFSLFLTVQSCKDSSVIWKGGEITDVGTYRNNDLTIKVYEEGNLLRYEMYNVKGDVLLKYDDDFTKHQHWGLFLDDDKNLWVFSSDIGDAVWKRDPSTGGYSKKKFHHWLTRDSVPSELYSSSMKRFLK